MKSRVGISVAVCAVALVSRLAFAESTASALSDEQISSLPAAGRDLGDMTKLQPDVAPVDRAFDPGSISLSGLRGEGGLFPTAGILDKDELSADYSVYFFDNDTEVINNNFEISFGLSDSVEIGLAGNVTLIDTDFQDDNYYSTGPALKWRPIANDVYQFTVGGALRGFASIALAFANNWKAVFEAGTKDSDFDENTPYSLALSVPASIAYKSDAIDMEIVPSIVEDGSGTGPSIQMAIRIRK